MADLDQLRLEYVPLATLQRAPRNPKGHLAEGIRDSIDRHGFVEPVIVDERTGSLLGGHGRLDDLEARQARGEPAPKRVLVADDGQWLMPTIYGVSSEDDQEAEALLLGLNQLPQAGGIAEPRMLYEMLDSLTTGPGLAGTGYTPVDVAQLLDSIKVPDFTPTPQDAQPRLDVRNPVVCPNCGHHFHRA